MLVGNANLPTICLRFSVVIPTRTGRLSEVFIEFQEALIIKDDTWHSLAGEMRIIRLRNLEQVIEFAPTISY